MIFKDSYGLPVDQTGDGGDSAARAGILALTNSNHKVGLSQYAWMRHPHDEPWNNPKNFTRDQAMCLLPKMPVYYVRQFFWQRLRAFFFAPNTERDYPGTTKYPWPHSFTDFDGNFTTRYFDGPDPLLPNHIGAMVIRGRVWQFYWLLPVCFLFHLLSLFLHSKSNHYEENQMICESYIYGTMRLYKMIHPRWEKVSREYWSRRNEIEYHNLLKEFLK
jgi:hypothetical protein